MDKRWIYILIIIIVGTSCLYLIAESSTTIGKATVKVNSYLVTVPDPFNIHSTGSHYAHLINRDTQERIFIEDLGKGDFINKNMSGRMADVEASGDNEDIENITVNIGNTSLPTIYYKDSNGTFNQISYIIKYNHTFYIKSSHFHDNSTIKSNVKVIIDSLTPNYKQKQED